MPNMFDYLTWRGDIPFSRLPPNNVDALIFSTLAYIRFDGVVPGEITGFVTLRDAAQQLLALPDAAERVRVENDLALLRAAALTERFGRAGLTYFQSVFIPEEETQFAAVTFLLEDGTAFLAFRGTDNTLVGWKEDFNMTFQESVPAQRLAQEYVRKFAAVSNSPLRLGGHSKGGNLAVYAGAKSDPVIQRHITDIFNHDGPGFTEHMMTDPGYLRIVPRIRTFVPQSSVFGLLLEREETHTVIRSSQRGLMQHDPYSWEVLGKDFVRAEELTPDSRFLDRTFKGWLAGMTAEERSVFFDTVFDLVMIDNTDRLRDILRPQNLRAYFNTLRSDETARRTIVTELINLAESARNAHRQEGT